VHCLVPGLLRLRHGYDERFFYQEGKIDAGVASEQGEAAMETPLPNVISVTSRM
jgi:hypothetical protein